MLFFLTLYIAATLKCQYILYLHLCLHMSIYLQASSICGFHIHTLCISAYLLKFPCNPQINTPWWFCCSFVDIHRVKFFIFSMCTHAQLTSNKVMLAFFQLSYCIPFCSIFSAIYFAFLCFLLMIWLFKMTPSIVLIPKHKKAVMCLTEKMPKLRAD